MIRKQFFRNTVVFFRNILKSLYGLTDFGIEVDVLFGWCKPLINFYNLKDDVRYY